MVEHLWLGRQQFTHHAWGWLRKQFAVGMPVPLSTCIIGAFSAPAVHWTSLTDHGETWFGPDCKIIVGLWVQAACR